MNCDKCEELISDLLDGSLSSEDQVTLNAHLLECLGCQNVRDDLKSILSFCETDRGNYVAPPNERALWLRIRNTIEAGRATPSAAAQPARKSWGAWLGRSWELSLPQLAASAAAIVLIVSLTTVVGLRRWQSQDPTGVQPPNPSSLSLAASGVLDRARQQQMMIDYWNKRVEINKARWSPEMRETFDRNLQVIDRAVNDSLNTLKKNPHDEVSEEMLNAALNEKLAILKEFAEL